MKNNLQQVVSLDPSCSSAPPAMKEDLTRRNMSAMSAVHQHIYES